MDVLFVVDVGDLRGRFCLFSGVLGNLFQVKYFAVEFCGDSVEKILG